MKQLTIIGFGEAGKAFAKGWQGAGIMANALASPIAQISAQICSFDIKTDDPATASAKRQDYVDAGVKGCDSLDEALAGAEVIFSLVTADQAEKVARQASTTIAPGSWYFDGNSCAPETKVKAAAHIEAAGGRYVDMAIMAPVHPALHKVAVLLSGEYTGQLGDIIEKLDLSAKIIDGPVGRASAIKMTRSIMMKGLEALMIECVLAGRKAGVDDIVLDSLEATYPGFGWKDRAAYMFERVITHGVRRAAEMREVAKTVDDLELGGTMAKASIDWHARIGDLGLDTEHADEQDYQQLADILLKTGKFGT